MNDYEKILLWCGATDYYIGRMTYAVQEYCQLLIREWETLPEKARIIIQKHVETAFEHDAYSRAAYQENDKRYPLGMDIDRAEWVKVRGLWKGGI